MDSVRLFNDDWDVVIDPKQGAIFKSCRYNGHDVFRAFEKGVDGGEFAPFLSAHFPLHPFSNRIGNGRFDFQRQTVEVGNNVPGEQYPLHGFGLISPWHVTEQKNETCQIEQHIKTDIWPWEYRAHHTISVRKNKLRLELEVANLSDGAMPCGIGFHPYFPNLETASIAFDSDGVWLCGEDRLPTEWTRSLDDYDFTQARRLKNVDLDHCFTKVGSAQIIWADRPLVINITSSQNLSRAAVFTDHSSNSFCFEPVSHTHNALNMCDPEGEGIQILATGESTSCWSEFEIEA